MIVRAVMAAALVALFVMGGCGRKGDPTPPEPELSETEEPATG